MELTLLESKDKPFRKEAIEKLLKHLDDNLPVDHSVLNWNDFFPSYLMFQMACEWDELGLNYLVLYRRTSHWNCEWIIDNIDYVTRNINVILIISNEINDLYQNVILNCNILACIQSAHLFDQLFHLLIEKLEQIESSHYKNMAKCKFLEVLILCNKIELADFYVRDLEGHYLNEYYRILGQYFLERNDIDSGMALFDKIEDEFIKIESISKSILHFIAKGEIVCANNLLERSICLYIQLDDDNHDEIISVFFLSLMKCGRYDLAIELANKLEMEHEKDTALLVICSELANSGQLDHANRILGSICDNYERSLCYAAIAKKYFELSKHSESNQNFHFALRESKCLMSITRDDWGLELSPRCKVLEAIAVDFIDIDENKFNTLLTSIKEIKSPSESLIKIILQPKIYKNSYIIKKCLLELLFQYNGFYNYSEYIDSLKQISLKLLANKQLDKVINVLSKISSKNEYDKVIDELICLCIKEHDFDNALILARHLNNIGLTCDKLLVIFISLWTLDYRAKALNTLLELKLQIDKITYNEDLRQKNLFELSNAYLKMDKEIDCYLIVDLMNDEFIHQERAILNLLKYNFVKGNLLEDRTLLKKLSKPNRNRFFKEISIEAAKVDHAYSILLSNKINNKSDKIEAQIEILKQFANKGDFSLARSMLNDCISEIRVINDKWEKGNFAKDLAVLYSILGEWQFALDICENIDLEDGHTKRTIILGVINQLLNKNLIKDAVGLIEKIENYIDSNYLMEAYVEICIELVRNGRVTEFENLVKRIHQKLNNRSLNKLAIKFTEIKKFDEALLIAKFITDIVYKINIILDVSEEYRKQNRSIHSMGIIQTAIEQNSSIRDSHIRDITLSKISIQLAKNEEFELAENLILEIRQIFERYHCWKKIGVNLFDENGYFKSNLLVNEFTAQEAKKYIKRGIIEQIDINELTREIALDVLKDGTNEISSVEFVLKMYALNQIFFGEIPEDNTLRFNRILNIQWAMDIANKN
jgi:tetratricopeptide (TPR) repeat protein